jgi:hypothetical protein
MIDHVRSNIGKTFLYVLPCHKDNYKKINNCIVCIVKVLKVRNDSCICEILEVINDYINFNEMQWYKDHHKTWCCSNEHLYERILYDQDGKRRDING